MTTLVLPLRLSAAQAQACSIDWPTIDKGGGHQHGRDVLPRRNPEIAKKQPVRGAFRLSCGYFCGIAITVREGWVYVGGSKHNKNPDMCTLKYAAGN